MLIISLWFLAGLVAGLLWLLGLFWFVWLIY